MQSFGSALVAGSKGVDVGVQISGLTEGATGIRTLPFGSENCLRGICLGFLGLLQEALHLVALLLRVLYGLTMLADFGGSPVKALQDRPGILHCLDPVEMGSSGCGGFLNGDGFLHFFPRLLLGLFQIFPGFMPADLCLQFGLALFQYRGFRFGSHEFLFQLSTFLGGQCRQSFTLLFQITQCISFELGALVGADRNFFVDIQPC